ncbi:hypothetical protein As57867_001770, partial [Aphanomyces stellatus]
MPSAASAHVVLASADVLPCICAFQGGLPEDMLPFASLRPLPLTTSAPITDFLARIHNLMADKTAITLWLARYSLTRLDRLVACCRHARAVLLDYAAYHGRLGLLQQLVAKNHEPFPTQLQNVWVVSATQGHVAMLEFLHTRAFRLLATDNNMDRAFEGGPSLTQMPDHPSATTLSNGALGHLLYVVAHVNQLEMLQWLFCMWVPPNAVSRRRVESKCLQMAVRNGYA